ncbi:hypothetical protein [Hymenobacter sp. DG25A]|uniref:hypothetical protein n=1 Tax=Hymenobacter sp. DG25A TaxID=1385663 RepID=UPI0012F9A2C8|nr:hypothetical protein [Hymenobacter sp. DG25A]
MKKQALAACTKPWLSDSIWVYRFLKTGQKNILSLSESVQRASASPCGPLTFHLTAMRYTTSSLLIGLLLLGASCTQDKVLQNPRNYATDSPPRRDNNKAKSRKEPVNIGLGIDLNAKNPQKFKTVKAPRKYKY